MAYIHHVDYENTHTVTCFRTSGSTHTSRVCMPPTKVLEPKHLSSTLPQHRSMHSNTRVYVCMICMYVGTVRRAVGLHSRHTCPLNEVQTHKHIHTYIHTSCMIPTYMPTYIHAAVHECMHPCIHTYGCMYVDVISYARANASCRNIAPCTRKLTSMLFQLPVPFEGRCGTANRSSACSSRGGGESFTLNQSVHLSLVTGCDLWSLNAFLHSAERVLFSLMIFERSFPSTGLV